MYSIKRCDDVNAITKRMIWLFAEEQKEMWLLASEWLATPAIENSMTHWKKIDFNTKLSKLI